MVGGKTRWKRESKDTNLLFIIVLLIRTHLLVVIFFIIFIVIVVDFIHAYVFRFHSLGFALALGRLSIACTRARNREK
jgi:hypothetical protein